MTMPVISVIIPVYNSEKYLAECLNSLLNQTYTAFEIICVDDGSTDGSYRILQEYAKMDQRIFVYTQKNQYAGIARNTGMKHARGKYLLFLDSDDFFCEDMLEKIVKKAEENNAEIVVFDAYRFNNQSKQVYDTEWHVVDNNLAWEGVKSANDISEKIFNFTSSAPWNKLFLKEFVKKHDLSFQKIKRTNDLFFVYAAFANAKKISILNKKLLYYRDNNCHSLQGNIKETPLVFSEALYALQDYLNKKGYYKSFQNSYVKMALGVCFCYLDNTEGKEYFELYNALKKDIIPRLCSEKVQNTSLIENEIYSHKNIIIYGAGAASKALVSFLIYECGYEKNRITIVVSDISKSETKVEEIEVREFKRLSDSCNNQLVFIAVSDVKIQNEIRKCLNDRGFVRSVRMSLDELKVLKMFITRYPE